MKFYNPKNESRTDDELFKCLLDEDEEVSTNACTALHFRCCQNVFDRARKLCSSSKAEQRKAGVSVLAQLGAKERPYYSETMEILLKLLDREKDSGVLASIGFAFSHNECDKATHLLCNLKSHSSVDVRLGVVLGITKNSNDLAIETLIELSDDADEDVRNWATFGIGTQIEADSAEIREALVKRLQDDNEEIQGEAMFGLAVRKDPRAIQPITEELLSENPRVFALESAQEMALEDFLPLLKALEEKVVSDSYFQNCLVNAIDACTNEKHCPS